MARTPAIVVAERAGIVFTIVEYEHEPSAGSYGLEAAEKLGVAPARVFKTLSVRQRWSQRARDRARAE